VVHLHDAQTMCENGTKSFSLLAKMHCKALSFWGGQKTLGFSVGVLESYLARIKLELS
jgi:hypothetical protein